MSRRGRGERSCPGSVPRRGDPNSNGPVRRRSCRLQDGSAGSILHTAMRPADGTRRAAAPLSTARYPTQPLRSDPTPAVPESSRSRRLPLPRGLSAVSSERPRPSEHADQDERRPPPAEADVLLEREGTRTWSGRPSCPHRRRSRTPGRPCAPTSAGPVSPQEAGGALDERSACAATAVRRVHRDQMQLTRGGEASAHQLEPHHVVVLDREQALQRGVRGIGDVLIDRLFIAEPVRQRCQDPSRRRRIAAFDDSDHRLLRERERVLTRPQRPRAPGRRRSGAARRAAAPRPGSWTRPCG